MGRARRVASRRRDRSIDRSIEAEMRRRAMRAIARASARMTTATATTSASGAGRWLPRSVEDERRRARDGRWVGGARSRAMGT